MPPKKKQVQINFEEQRDDAAGIVNDTEGNRFVNIKEIDLNNIHPFDQNDLKWGVKIIVLGKPGTGKSTIIESLMFYKSWICPVSQAFSGSENVNHFYATRMTPITIHNDIDLKALEDFAKRQNIAREYLPVPWGFQVIDDCTDDPSILKKKPFPSYYRKGRHWAMIHVEGTHTPMDLAPGQRSCIDYVFILANSVISDREKIYQNYASGAIPNYSDFCDIMDQLTEDHTALVIDNTSSSSIISERVFYFKAEPSRIPPKWKMGCDEAWDFNNERMDPSYRDSYL